MIYTLTLNPSLDITIEADELKSGDVLRSRSSRRDAGGKGINISRALRALGEPSIALGFSGGVNGMVIENLLREAGLVAEMVAVDGEVRSNLSLVVRRPKRHYKLNEAGPLVSRVAQERLLTLIKGKLSRGDYLVVSGSLPPGPSAAYIKRIVRLARKKRTRVILDADGEALRQGIEGGPFLVKPNRQELLRLLGWRKFDAARAVPELKKLVCNGLRHVVVSLGGEGALYCGRAGAFSVRPPRVKLASEVGCGDALVAGLAWSLKGGREMDEALRWGVAAGTAKVMCEGTLMPTRQEIERIHRKVKLSPLS